MESSPEGRSVLGRRGVLRVFAAVPAAALMLTACSPEPEPPDPLLAPATDAKSDVQLAKAIAQAHPDLAATANEVAAARGAHAEAMVREIERLKPRDPEDPPSVPEPAPKQAPGSSKAAGQALRETLSAAQKKTAQLVPGLPAYRAGLLGSVSASCASLQEVLA